MFCTISLKLRELSNSDGTYPGHKADQLHFIFYFVDLRGYIGK